MQISFLLGPAGSGKTFRCLNEIRSELLASPEGSPLILIAPKQATFQLERQLLETGELRGYTRLRILSFERLAQFVFESTLSPLPNLLSEQGRVMVLRALLEECRPHLGIFRRCARRLGFAQELSDQLREFQQMGLSPGRVVEMANRTSARTADKLRDLALLFAKYRDWLKENQIEDADALLGIAADRLDSEPGLLRIGGVWLDGFAQLTPEERKLLTSILAISDRARLAFCLESESRVTSPLSPWFLVSETWLRCRVDLESRFGKGSTEVEWFQRDPDRSRFSRSPELARLERCWARPRETNETDPVDLAPATHENAIELIRCADPEAEAVCCAREILRFIRSGARFREAAVLLRGFENDYVRALPRVFRKYGIPYFLDHRENVAHHPVAELTRGTLRALAFGWKHTDLFTAFKSGLTHIQPDPLDELENEALANGWEGCDWRNGFAFRASAKPESYLEILNRRRELLIAPLLRLEKQCGSACSGEVLAEAIRDFWDRLQVAEQVETWAENPGETFHTTVLEQMDQWLTNLQLAFRHRSMSLREWLPILEAGLTGLTVGIIPPVLDQVLIGAVDRSRNPDLRVTFVLGLNEGVFPAVPARDQLLTENDRLTLLDLGCELSRIPALQIAQEQFYGYIASTRSREKLFLSYSVASLDGKTLNPSRFLAHIARIAPAMKEKEWAAPNSLDQVEHASELFPFLALLPSTASMPEQGTAVAAWRQKMNALHTPNQSDALAAEMALRLYGRELKMAVSSMERFAACPYRFFLEQGLKVRERTEFELDVREQGRFQHEILLEFHRAVCAQGRRWRDFSRDEALALINSIADKQIASFAGGLFAANEQSRFIGENYKSSLGRFITAVIDWFDANSFDPFEVELPFGEGQLPGWRVPLENGKALLLCGRIDRVDLFREPSTRRACCVIMDYKSGMRRPDRSLIEHGIEQQLPAYLLALTQMEEAKALFQVDELIGVGCFLIPLRSTCEATKNREEALDNSSEVVAYKHFGFFDREHLESLDQGHQTNPSGQFHYKLKNDGTPNKQGFHAVESGEFARILSGTRTLLRSFGKRIYDGDIAIRPFKKGTKTACAQCHQQPICRFDSWTQEFNVIAAPPHPGPQDP